MQRESKGKFYNNKNGSIVSWTSTAITVKVPTGATTGPLKVKKGTQFSNQIPFTVGTEEVRYHHTDGIGSVRLVTGHGGHVWERHDYQPFGVEMPPVTGDESVRFAGKEHDPETGASGWTALNYFGARYLHSATGRFTATDPLMVISENVIDPQRWNRFSYVRNNPLRFIDPDGRHTKDKWFGFKNRDFQDWFHKNIKPDIDRDVLDKDEMQEYFDLWEQEGKPKRDPKGERRRDGNRQRHNFDEEPDSDPDPSPQQRMIEAVPAKEIIVGAGAVYVIYRGLRLLPSLAPPLWPTLPLNVVAP